MANSGSTKGRVVEQKMFYPETIDVNCVNVNAFDFYFTPILVEIDVQDIFYILPLKLRLCGKLRSFSCSYPQKDCFLSTSQTLRVCRCIDLEP